MPNGLHTNRWDMHKKIDLKTSKERSTSMSNYKSIKEFKQREFKSKRHKSCGKKGKSLNNTCKLLITPKD